MENPRDPAYYNKLKKDAWRELCEKFEKSTEELKKKIDSLKGSYRREKTRAKTSMGTGKGKEREGGGREGGRGRNIDIKK